MEIRRPKQNSTTAPTTRGEDVARRSNGRTAGGDHRSPYSSTGPADPGLLLGELDRVAGPTSSYSLPEVGHSVGIGQHFERVLECLESSTTSTTTLGRPWLVITTRRCSVSIPSTTSDRRALASARETCSVAGVTISRTISLHFGNQRGGRRGFRPRRLPEVLQPLWRTNR